MYGSESYKVQREILDLQMQLFPDQNPSKTRVKIEMNSDDHDVIAHATRGTAFSVEDITAAIISDLIYLVSQANSGGGVDLTHWKRFINKN